MKSFFSSLIVLTLFVLFSQNTSAQVFDGYWRCLYSTLDDQPNSTGYPTAAVGVIKPNTFVTLISRLTTTSTTCYLVGYTDATHSTGRMGYYLYGSAIAGYKQVWASGFDNVEMLQAMDIAVSKDSLVYVASNDIERNILVFKMSTDSVISTEYRMVTGADSIYAIDIDQNGRVYVTKPGTNGTDGKILVFKGISEDANWAGTHNSTPLYEIVVPNGLDLRGVTVNKEGTLIYVSDYTNKFVKCFTGSPSTGYTLYNGFSYTFTDQPMASNGIDTIFPGPIGLTYMNEKNLVMLSCAQMFRLGVAYEYSKVYFLNPNTGAVLDMHDAAAWNFASTGSYSTPNDSVSAYASLYGSHYDENYDLYTVSYYGWSIDKWKYTGTLPVIPVTILGIEKNNDVMPSEFSLSQNYPNPFNPSTTIEFSVTENALVTLNIYDVNGQLVSELISTSSLEKGNYKVKFDASKLASGTYVYSLKVGNTQLTKKMTLLK